MCLSGSLSRIPKSLTVLSLPLLQIITTLHAWSVLSVARFFEFPSEGGEQFSRFALLSGMTSFSLCWKKKKSAEPPGKEFSLSATVQRNNRHGRSSLAAEATSSNASRVSGGAQTCDQDLYHLPSACLFDSGDSTETKSLSLLGPKLFVAKYSYEARTEEDLSFKKGDILELVDESAGNWWLVWSRATEEEGYVPSNFLAQPKSLDAHEWYFGLLRRYDAERLLLLPENDHGSFLIRKSESGRGHYSLSVRDKNSVKHYCIRRIDHGEDGSSYYISRHAKFETVLKLVQHYHQNAHDLCVNLQAVCKRAELPQTIGLAFGADALPEIPHDSLEKKKKICDGVFGEMWEGSWNKKVPIAIKVVSPEMIAPQDLLNAAQLLKKLHHPRLAQFHAVCTTEQPMMIVMELINSIHGSLLNYLITKRQSIKLTQLIDLAAQVALGMAYLEQQNYPHSSLAAHSVLLTSTLLCKVTDIGLFKLLNDDNHSTQSTEVFLVKWTAPEAVLSRKFTIKSDVWSFGVLLMELVTYGRVPYDSMTNAQVLTKLEHGYRMPCPARCPEKLYEMMLDCWCSESLKRPSFESLQWQLEDFFNNDTALDDAYVYS